MGCRIGFDRSAAVEVVPSGDKSLRYCEENSVAYSDLRLLHVRYHLWPAQRRTDFCTGKSVRPHRSTGIAAGKLDHGRTRLHSVQCVQQSSRANDRNDHLDRIESRPCHTEDHLSVQHYRKRYRLPAASNRNSRLSSVDAYS
ncbi:hypothetical protein D3C71_1706410 [compost metagenome]